MRQGPSSNRSRATRLITYCESDRCRLIENAQPDTTARGYQMPVEFAASCVFDNVTSAAGAAMAFDLSQAVGQENNHLVFSLHLDRRTGSRHLPSAIRMGARGVAVGRSTCSQDARCPAGVLPRHHDIMVFWSKGQGEVIFFFHRGRVEGGIGGRLMRVRVVAIGRARGSASASRAASASVTRTRRKVFFIGSKVVSACLCRSLHK